MVPWSLQEVSKLFSMATILPHHPGSKNDLQFPELSAPRSLPLHCLRLECPTPETTGVSSPLTLIQESARGSAPSGSLPCSPASPLILLMKHANTFTHKRPPSISNMPSPEPRVLTPAQSKTDWTLGPCSTS